jgi:branched-chain amino acid transport system ATP-binding protein
MLSIENVKSGYGRISVLHDVSLEVDTGVIGLFGPNGAGKTTLINAVLGMNRVDTGTITFEGREIQNSPTHEIVRGGIALVPQERELFPLMTVMENLVVGAEQIEHARGRIEESLQEVFSHFPILNEREKTARRYVEWWAAADARGGPGAHGAAAFADP